MTNQIKNITKAILVGGMVLFAGVATASTTTVFSPSTINTAPGKTFTVTVTLNSNGAQNFAEEVDVNFPASLLEVKSFTFANDWMALTQADYDKIDNVNGLLVKSAGYPGGFSGVKTYGTITFTVKKAGSGLITLGSESTAFDANSEVPMTAGSVTVNSVSTAVQPTPTATPTPTPTVTGTVVTPVATVSATTTATSTPEVVTATTSDQLAQVASSGFNMNWLWAILGIIVLGGVVYYFVRKN